MESRNTTHSDDLRRRIKRRRFEIVIASVLTLTALAYLGVTLLHWSEASDQTGRHEKPSLTQQSTR